MELKQGQAQEYKKLENPFNQTRMELKPETALVKLFGDALLIRPEWN